MTVMPLSRWWVAENGPGGFSITANPMGQSNKGRATVRGQ